MNAWVAFRLPQPYLYEKKYYWGLCQDRVYATVMRRDGLVLKCNMKHFNATFRQRFEETHMMDMIFAFLQLRDGTASHGGGETGESKVSTLILLIFQFCVLKTVSTVTIRGWSLFAGEVYTIVPFSLGGGGGGYTNSFHLFMGLHL